MLIFSFIVFGLVILFLIYAEFRLFYFRYLKEYDADIYRFLKNKELIFIEKKYPDGDDWKRNPFSGEPDLPFSKSTTRIFGFTTKNHARGGHVIFYGKKGYDLREFWMIVETKFLHAPYIRFKEVSYLQ